MSVQAPKHDFQTQTNNKKYDKLKQQQQHKSKGLDYSPKRDSEQLPNQPKRTSPGDRRCCVAVVVLVPAVLCLFSCYFCVCARQCANQTMICLKHVKKLKTLWNRSRFAYSAFIWTLFWDVFGSFLVPNCSD